MAFRRAQRLPDLADVAAVRRQEEDLFAAAPKEVCSNTGVREKTCTPKFAPRASFQLKNSASDAKKHEESENPAKIAKFLLKKSKCSKVSRFQNFENFRCLAKTHKSEIYGVHVFSRTPVTPIGVDSKIATTACSGGSKYDEKVDVYSFAMIV